MAYVISCLQAPSTKLHKVKAVIDEPASAKLVSLTNANGEATTLTLVETPQGTRHLLVNEVLHKLLCDFVSKGAWLKSIEASVGRDRQPFKAVGPVLRKKLVLMGVISKMAAIQLLMTLANTVKAVKYRAMPTAVLQGLTDLHSNQGVVLGGAAITNLVMQNGVGSTMPFTLQLAEHLPTMVDTASCPALGPRQRYSLEIVKPSLAHSATLTMQLEELSKFCKLPLVMVRGSSRRVKSDTFEDKQKHIMLFLGFIHVFCGVVHPNLQHLVRADFWAKYAGSRGARGDKGVSICQVLSTAKCVVGFWQSKCTSQSSHLLDLRKWLGDLSSQVRRAYPSVKRSVNDMVQRGTWADAADIVVVLCKAKVSIEAEVSHLGRLSIDQARRLHDVALACAMFGFLPPPRSACIRTLSTPRYRGPCPDKDCTNDRCWGNRLYVSEGTTMHMELPHHKTEHKWGTIRFVLPADLSALLSLYLNKAYDVLREDMEVEHGYMFMSTTGMAFTTDYFSTYFKGIMTGLGGPAVAPHSLRHIFVVEQMNAQGNEQHEGAAYCMGHDLSQWNESYDLLSLQRKGQRAIDGMQAWREALLARRGVGAPAPSIPQVLEVQSDREGSSIQAHSPSEAMYESSSDSASESLPSGVQQSDGDGSSASSESEDELVIDLDE